MDAEDSPTWGQRLKITVKAGEDGLSSAAPGRAHNYDERFRRQRRCRLRI